MNATRYGVIGCGTDGLVIDTHAQPIDAIVWRGPYAVAVEAAAVLEARAPAFYAADVIGRELGRAIVERDRA